MPGLAAREAAWLASRQSRSAPRRQQAQARSSELYIARSPLVHGCDPYMQDHLLYQNYWEVLLTL